MTFSIRPLVLPRQAMSHSTSQLLQQLIKSSPQAPSISCTISAGLGASQSFLSNFTCEMADENGHRNSLDLERGEEKSPRQLLADAIYSLSTDPFIRGWLREICYDTELFDVDRICYCSFGAGTVLLRREMIITHISSLLENLNFTSSQIEAQLSCSTVVLIAGDTGSAHKTMEAAQRIEDNRFMWSPHFQKLEEFMSELGYRVHFHDPKIPQPEGHGA